LLYGSQQKSCWTQQKFLTIRRDIVWFAAKNLLGAMNAHRAHVYTIWCREKTPGKEAWKKFHS
jgi:hypothetical protein